MTTNPYASPVHVGELVDRADHEIRSVIRTFRILAIFSIAQALLFCVSMIMSLASANNEPISMLLLLTVHLAMIACSVFYLRVAGRMARKDVGVAKWAGRLCLLMILGFPLFPIGLFCVPVFGVAGVLCFRKVKRHYLDYCEAPES